MDDQKAAVNVQLKCTMTAFCPSAEWNVLVGLQTPPRHTHRHSLNINNYFFLNDGQQLKDTRTGNIYLDVFFFFSFLFLVLTLLEGFVTLALIPADLPCIVMDITTAAGKRVHHLNSLSAQKNSKFKRRA